FFSSRRRHTRFSRDWSSDVCSSDLKALIGDAVSHAVLPGICAAFLFAGSKNIGFMLAGAFVTGWLALIAIDYIVANSKIKKDARSEERRVGKERKSRWSAECSAKEE